MKHTKWMMMGIVAAGTEVVVPLRQGLVIAEIL